jgi:hypothetical protein
MRAAYAVHWSPASIDRALTVGISIMHKTIVRSCMMAAALLGTGMSGAIATPTTYSLFTTIAVPSAGPAINPNLGGSFASFDTSFFDPTTRLDYVADRSNASVDVFSGSTFLGRTASLFTGQQTTTSASGPNGVLTISNGSQHTLFAGDGDSTLKSFNISSASLPPPQQFPALNTGGSFRADLMAYSPSANLVLVVNNADSPPFATLVNSSTGATVVGHITIPGVTEGLVQPVWDPNTNSFFITVPQFGTSGPGGVAEIKTDGTVGRLYDFSAFGITNCSPTGLALGASGHLMVGCGDTSTQTVVLDPTGTGSIVTTFAQISGSDQIWYDPTLGDFFATGVSGGGRVFDVISDASLEILQSVGLPDVNAHSIAVDPGNGFVYVPLPASTSFVADALCPLGCVAVYAQSVPEPGTLALLGIAAASLAWCRRKQ